MRILDMSKFHIMLACVFILKTSASLQVLHNMRSQALEDTPISTFKAIHPIIRGKLGEGGCLKVIVMHWNNTDYYIHGFSLDDDNAFSLGIRV